MSIYTTKEPLLLRGVFKKFDDTRGFLSAIDLRDLELSVNCENFHYQLLTHTNDRYTFRGFHFQEKPFEQDKLIFIHSGRLIDIVFPVNLKAPNDIKIFDLFSGDALYVPKGYAHGYITVCENVVLQYLMNNSFSTEHYTGINGKNIANLVKEDCLVSEKDLTLPQNFSIESLLRKELNDWLAIKKVDLIADLDNIHGS